MIVVWGSIKIKENEMEKAIALSLEHVHRSRQEPGCIKHSVQIDVEDANTLIFYEEWQDMTALQTHFAVPDSGHFIKDISAVAVAAPEMKIYTAEQVR